MLYVANFLDANGREHPSPYEHRLTGEQVQDLFFLAMLEGSDPCEFNGATRVYRLGALVIRPKTVFDPVAKPAFDLTNPLALQGFLE